MCPKSTSKSVGSTREEREEEEEEEEERVAVAVAAGKWEVLRLW